MQIYILYCFQICRSVRKTTERAYHDTKNFIGIFDDNKFIKATLCCVLKNSNFISC